MGERMRWRLGLIAFYVLALAAVRFAQALRFDWEGIPAFTSVLVFALVIGLEIGLSVRFEGARLRRAGVRVRSLRFLLAGVGFLGRVGLWGVIFWFAVEYPGFVDRGDEDVFVRGVALRLWEFTSGQIVQLGWIVVAILLVLWLAAFEFVVRTRRLRATVFVAVPLALLVAATLLSYRFGTGMVTLEEVLSQPDVELVYAPGPDLPEKERLVWNHPRGVRLLSDGRTVLMSFGGTLLGQRGSQPNLWKIDIETGDASTIFTESPTWAFETDPDEETLYVLGWHHRYILVVDLASFLERGRILMKDSWPYPCYEPTDSFSLGTKMLIAMNAIPTILLFDMASERVVDEIDLTEMGILQDGDTCCLVSPVSRSGNVYLQATDSKGTVSIVLDPERFEVKKVARMPSSTRFQTVWEQDDGSEILLLAGEFSEGLWGLDPEASTFTLVSEMEGMGQSEVAYDSRTGLVWVLSRPSGRLVAMGEDFAPRRSWTVGSWGSRLLLAGDHVYVATRLGLFRLPRHL